MFLRGNSIPEGWGEIFLLWIPSAVCILYLLKIIGAYAFQRPEFDWHLVNGNFLGKVICLVILMPILLTTFIRDKETGADGLIQPNIRENAVETQDIDKEDNLFWTVFVHFIDPGLQVNASKDGNARNWSAIIAMLGIFLLNGLLVSSVIAWVDKRKENWLKGETRYGCIRGHYVIIGGNDMVSGIVRQIFHSPGSAKILILTSRDVESFRRELHSSLDEACQKRVIVYYGTRTSIADIEGLKLKRAKEIYLLGEDSRTDDDKESYHDSLNMKCLQIIRDYYTKEYAGGDKSADNRRIVCRVMFEYQTTFSVFQFSEISNSIKNHIDFKPFNYYEMWAQKVLISKELKESDRYGGYLPLEGFGKISENSDEYVHLVIVGMSRMGTAMAIEAAHLAHYPNYKKARTRITFIDLNARREGKFFRGRFKELFELSNWRYGCTSETGDLMWDNWQKPYCHDYLGGDFLDIEWEFINGGIEDKAVQDYLLKASQKTPKMTIAMCVPEASKCLAHALYLDRRIYDNALQILVYNRYDDALTEEMIEQSACQYNPFNKKIKAFGMASEGYDALHIEQAEFIAGKVGNKYNQIQAGQKKEKQVKALGKSQVVKWWSNIYNADMFWSKLRFIGWDGKSELTDEELDIISRVEHNRWNIEQLLLRCRPLTEKKQKEIMENPLLKEVYKGKMAHFNICSNERLGEIDKTSQDIDRGLSEILPSVYCEINTKWPAEQTK